MPRRFSDWLRQARRNLLSARVNAEHGLYEEVCYEAHQAAEKALKALLHWLGVERRGHALVFLLREIEARGVGTPSEVRRCLFTLDKHYIPSRYPDVYKEGAPADYYTEEDAATCLSCAEVVLRWVEDVVGGSMQQV